MTIELRDLGVNDEGRQLAPRFWAKDSTSRAREREWASSLAHGVFMGRKHVSPELE